MKNWSVSKKFTCFFSSNPSTSECLTNLESTDFGKLSCRSIDGSHNNRKQNRILPMPALLPHLLTIRIPSIVHTKEQNNVREKSSLLKLDVAWKNLLWRSKSLHGMFVVISPPQQTFVLMKRSWRHLSFSSSEDVLIKTNMFALTLRLQDVLVKTNIFVLAIRLQDVFKTSCKNVFKTSSRRLAKISSRRFQDVLSS